MWQEESEATNSSSGSTIVASLKGAGTIDGDAEAEMTAPPSK
ncbi:hypothetical protein [Mesorhizobium sp. M1334]